LNMANYQQRMSAWTVGQLITGIVGFRKWHGIEINRGKSSGWPT
jgi:hypothetical protein